ncbi:p37 [Honeysuckle ringspot virus]|uniref:Capsid protein n=1 Tax=Honeysuckle ringspot virus TaxID=943272 RepID=E7EEK8_9TOMB|nr:p37 [Honeysuckle ringspot virus]ADV15472.1 p37 [Honeysuckle ringspot virus]
MDTLRNSKKVAQLSASGVLWATKYMTRGWQSLSTNQKRLARAALNLPLTPQVISPVRPRVRNPQPRGAANGLGQAGKTQTITRSEYVADVVKTVGATPTFTTWVINPRSVRSFPGTSVCSLGYEKYRVVNFRVRYSNSLSDDVSGKVSIGFTPDSSDPIPTNKTQLYQMRVSMDTAAKESKTLTIPTDNATRYLRDSSIDDAKVVDFGRVVLATYGFDQSAPEVIGEIHFEYTLVLSDPNFVTTLTQKGTNSEYEGPLYGALERTNSAITLTLQAPGNWLVVWISPEAFNSPTVTGSGASGTVSYQSGGSSMAVTTVIANLPGAQVTAPTTTAVKELQWYVSRL